MTGAPTYVPSPAHAHLVLADGHFRAGEGTSAACVAAQVPSPALSPAS